jgi:hypothetical protein
MPAVTDAVKFVDDKGVEHEALVTQVYPDHGGPGLDAVDLVYVEPATLKPVELTKVIHKDHTANAFWKP